MVTVIEQEGFMTKVGVAVVHPGGHWARAEGVVKKQSNVRRLRANVFIKPPKKCLKTLFVRNCRAEITEV